MTTSKLAGELQAILNDFAAATTLEPNRIFVVGCSTSEVVGSRIGKGSSPEVANVFYPIFADFAQTHGLHLAFQACEHLNRALVVEKAFALSRGLTIVHAIPQPKAGGSMASRAFQAMEQACLVESIQADYGLDIGFTMIGMHMKPVVVPLRLDHYDLGQTKVQAAYSRPKLIGGARAIYDMGSEK